MRPDELGLAGIDGAGGASAGAGDDSEAGPDGEAAGSGDVFVGPLFTKSRMRSGVLVGVTLSISWKDGRRSTVVLSSACSGMGIFDAESISRCCMLVI